MERGRFIVFEGIDGAGKTTQVGILAERLREMGKRVVITAEPTTLPSGKALREVLGGRVKKSDCEIAAMFTLDRIAHNVDAEGGIEKLVSEGAYVICDRYYYSSLAYQGSLVDYGWVKSLNTECPEIRHPDLCVFLDLTPAESMRRISAGRESTEIYENDETLTRVREAFMRVIDDMSAVDNIVVVNAATDISSISEKIFEQVEKIL